MNEQRINALYCALETLRGQGGGFSPHERQSAIEQLILMLQEEQAK
jgi:hypothetical protein